MKSLFVTTALITAGYVGVSALAATAESRALGAHEHGQGALNIAVEGATILMEFEAPGADIVGFEYKASSPEDRSAVDAAIAVLAKPLDLFTPPAAAGCVVTAAQVALITEESGHDDHDGHDEHNGHDDHADEGHDDHAQNGHAQEGDHDDHENHDAHAHDDHADEGGAGHTEFHAEYTLNCADPAAITTLDLGYFARFPNAEALSVQLISAQGAKGYEAKRDDMRLDLSGAI